MVFTTAYQEYALEGYQLDIVDYLLKPFRFDRFLQAVNKAARRLQTEKRVEEELPKGEMKDHILVKANHTIYKIRYDEILFIEGMKEYVAYHLPEQRIVALQSLKQLEVELPSDKFVRVHKSFIISRNKVSAMDTTHVFIGKKTIPIGGNYKEMLQNTLFPK